MVSINTNLTSLITQRSMLNSTNRLNSAIERLSTGYKINHAGDNAANYSISNNMNVQLSSYDIASDNISMGMDLLQTAQDTIAGMQDRGNRIQALMTQARNGTYGESSLAAINSEAQALVSEINRLYINTEYNGIKIFENIELPDWAQEVKVHAGTIDGKSLEQCAADNNGFIDDIHCDTPDIIVTDPDQLATAISTKFKIGIGNAETLAKLAELVNSGTTCEGKTIILTEDVDLSAICAANTDAEGNGGWTPIGNQSYSFDGHFNGNGHKVTGLYIKRSEYQGLFGRTTGVLRNIGVEGANVTGGGRIGGLAGEAVWIENCYVTGSVSGIHCTGGLAGRLLGDVSTSYTTATVTGEDLTGGLVGMMYIDELHHNPTVIQSGIDAIFAIVPMAKIGSCYSTGDVSGLHNNGGLVGGIMQENPSCKLEIDNCYVTGNVTGEDFTNGFVGGYMDGYIKDSYVTGNIISHDTTVFAHGDVRILGSYATGNLIFQVDGIKPLNIYWDRKEKEWSFSPAMTNLQVGINSNSDSRITVDTNLKLNLNISDLTSDSAYNSITSFLNQLSQKSTELGAAQNRLESALESTMVQMDNLTSSLSTIRDADIGEVSSDYIRQQILQQASATLMSTANQSPSIALQLI